MARPSSSRVQSMLRAALTILILAGLLFESSYSQDTNGNGGIFISGAELDAGAASIVTTGLPSRLATATAGAPTMIRVSATNSANSGVNALSSFVRVENDTSLTTITTTMLTVTRGLTSITVLTTAIPASALAAQAGSHNEAGSASSNIRSNRLRLVLVTTTLLSLIISTHSI